MPTMSPDVKWRISKKHDMMIGQMLSGIDLSGAGVDTLLQQVKTYLDANYSNFKDPATGDYSAPHVRSAVLTLLSRGK